MIYLYIYIAGVFIVQILTAISNEDADARDTIAISFLWPIALIIVLIYAAGWNIAAVYCNTKLGFRRHKDSKLPGFAIAIFNIEFQFWKRAK